MGSPRLVLLLGALVACGETPFLASPPAPEGARSILLAYRSATSEPKEGFSLSRIGEELPMRGELDAAAVLYFDESVDVLEAGEDCNFLRPRTAFVLDSLDAPAWQELEAVVDQPWLVELLLEDASACQPCFAFERERWLPRIDPPSDLLRNGFSLTLPSGAALIGTHDLALVTTEVRSLGACPPLARYRAGALRGPEEIYVAGAARITDPPFSSIYRLHVDEPNLRCDQVEIVTSSVPASITALAVSGSADPLELVIVTDAGKLHRWTETRGLEELHTFERSEIVPRDTASIARLGASTYAASAGGTQVVFFGPETGLQLRSVPMSTVSSRGLRDMTFIEGLGLFGIEGRDNLFRFDEALALERIAVPSTLLLSKVLPLGRGVLISLRGGSLLQYDVRTGFCPPHDVASVDTERSIEVACIGRERVLLVDASDRPADHALEIPIDPVKPPLLPP